jgi:hypothetical protein
MSFPFCFFTHSFSLLIGSRIGLKLGMLLLSSLLAFDNSFGIPAIASNLLLMAMSIYDTHFLFLISKQLMSTA